MPIVEYKSPKQMGQSEENQQIKKQKNKKCNMPSFPLQVINLLSYTEPLPMKDEIVDVLEKKISQWLDANNIIQVNPIDKQYKYYSERKQGIVSLKQRNSSPKEAIAFSRQTEEEINTSLQHPSPVALSLCKNNLLKNRKNRLDSFNKSTTSNIN